MAETTSLIINVKSDSVGKATKDLKKLGTQAKVTATSTGRFGTAAKKIRPAAASAATGIRGVGVAMKSLAASTVALLIPLAALIAPFAIFKKLLDAGTSIGKFRAQLKTATGSVEQAAYQFQELTKFAMETPFALDQTIDTFIKMKNLGLDPTNESMRALGNLASGLGKDFSETSAAVAKASIGNAESLRDMGFQFSKVGEEITIGFRDTRLTVENDSKKIVAAIVGIADAQFGGAMAAEMDTLGGKLSNLGDRWDQMWIGIAEAGVDDWMGNLFDSIGGYFLKFEEMFTSGSVQAELESWSISFSLIWEEMKKGWKLAGEQYNKFLKLFGFSETSDIMDGVLAAIREVPIALGGLMKVAGLFPGFMGEVGRLAGTAFYGMIGGWIERTSTAFKASMIQMAKQAANPAGVLLDTVRGEYKSPVQVFKESLGDDSEFLKLTNQIGATGAAILKNYGSRIDKIKDQMTEASEAAAAEHEKAKGLLGTDRPPLEDPSKMGVPFMLERPMEEDPEGVDGGLSAKDQAKLDKLAERLAREQELKDKAAATAAERAKAAQKRKDDAELKAAIDLEKRTRAMKLEGAASLADGLSKLASHFGEKGAKAQKALAITSATIDMYTGATAAMADPTVKSTTAKYLMAAGVIANGMANIAAITSAGNYANGGIIPGNSTSGDRLQANVNSGEMILNQKQQANLFKQANSAGGGGSVTINNYGNDNVETKKDSDGNMEIIIRQAADLAKSELADEINTGDGDFAPMMQSTFGLQRGLS